MWTALHCVLVRKNGLADGEFKEFLLESCLGLCKMENIGTEPQHHNKNW